MQSDDSIVKIVGSIEMTSSSSLENERDIIINIDGNCWGRSDRRGIHKKYISIEHVYEFVLCRRPVIRKSLAKIITRGLLFELKHS